MFKVVEQFSFTTIKSIRQAIPMKKMFIMNKPIFPSARLLKAMGPMFLLQHEYDERSYSN